MGRFSQAFGTFDRLMRGLNGVISALASQVEGTIADGTAVGAQNPVTVGGVDYVTGFAHRLQVNADGQLSVVTLGTVANGAAGNPAPVVSGGVNGGNVLSFNSDALGNQVISQGPGATANPWTVQGQVANNVAASGNSVPIGGVYQSAAALTALTAGTRADFQADVTGNLRAALTGISGTGADASSNNVGYLLGTASGTTGNNIKLSVVPMKFNGATWDRDYKPRTAFRIPSSAASNNVANIKTTPGTVLSISFNVTLAASTCYLKFFDTTGSPNPAALTPLYMFACNINEGFASLNLPAGGLYFPTGIGVAIVANPADLDNTAIAAGQVTALNVSFQ